MNITYINVLTACTRLILSLGEFYKNKEVSRYFTIVSRFEDVKCDYEVTRGAQWNFYGEVVA